jgi:hypothetical protein
MAAGLFLIGCAFLVASIPGMILVYAFVKVFYFD